MGDQKRPCLLYRRVIRSGAPDELPYQEDDELHRVGVSESLDGWHVFVTSCSKETSETRFLVPDDPDTKLQCIARPRK